MSFLDSIEVFFIKLPLKNPFQTSFGVQLHNEGLLLKLTTITGVGGWAEIPLTFDPGYCYETTYTAYHILKDFIIPILIDRNQKNNIISVNDWINNLYDLLKSIRGHNFTKAGIDFCLWNIKSKLENKSLPQLLEATRKKIPVGVSIGIQQDKEILLQTIQKALNENYHRIKIKIEPKKDVEFVKFIRNELGDIPLMVDANSAYSLDDSEILAKLDRYNLQMIEQPLAYDDIVDHASLQRNLSTPICLDESIKNLDDTRKAISIGSCKIINLKPARVGGLSESLKIADYCYKNKIDLWCGGMLESGVGRIINVALQANEKFTYPGDTSPSQRYYFEDLIDPEVKMDNDGTVRVDQTYEVLSERIKKYTTKNEFFKLRA